MYHRCSLWTRGEGTWQAPALRRAYSELADVSIGEGLRFGVVELNQERLQVTCGSNPVDLTPIEFRLLRYVVTHPNRPLSRDALIAKS